LNTVIAACKKDQNIKDISKFTKKIKVPDNSCNNKKSSDHISINKSLTFIRPHTAILINSKPKNDKNKETPLLNRDGNFITKPMNRSTKKNTTKIINTSFSTNYINKQIQSDTNRKSPYTSFSTKKDLNFSLYSRNLMRSQMELNRNNNNNDIEYRTKMLEKKSLANSSLNLNISSNNDYGFGSPKMDY